MRLPGTHCSLDKISCIPDSAYPNKAPHPVVVFRILESSSGAYSPAIAQRDTKIGNKIGPHLGLHTGGLLGSDV